MTATLERMIIRLFHLLITIPIIEYFTDGSEATFPTTFVLLMIALSVLWMWKREYVRPYFKENHKIKG